MNPLIAEYGKKTRFPVNRPHAPVKGPTLTPLLRKALEKKIKFEDPETQKIIKGRVKDAVVWRLLLNATQGDNEAIKEVLNRIDGKQVEQIIANQQNTNITFVTNIIDRAKSIAADETQVDTVG